MIKSVKKYIPVILLSFRFLFSGLPPSNAQVLDSMIMIDELEIRSSRIDAVSGNAGRHITILGPDDIRRLPVHSLDELFMHLTSFDIRSRGPFGVQSDLSLRGCTFNQVLILLDGVRVNDPLTGHFNHQIPVALHDIRRIEIIRGASAALYGPDAVGGVVNIITKTFDGISGPGGFSGQISGTYGQHDLFGAHSGINYKTKNLLVGGGFGLNRSEGHPLAGDTLNGDFDIRTVSVSLAAEPSSKIRFALRSGLDTRDFNARFFYTSSPFDLSREKVRKFRNQAQITYSPGSGQRSALRIGYNITRDTFRFNPAFPVNHHEAGLLVLQWEHSVFLTDKMKISGGIDHQRMNIRSNDRGDHREHMTGIHMSALKTLPAGLSLLASLRMHFNPLYAAEILPQINLSYARKDLTLRGSAGRAIRTPDFTERYVSTHLEGPLSPGRNLGNPLLTPESSWNLEAGTDYNLSTHLLIRATAFKRFSRDLIDFVQTREEHIPDAGNLQSGEEYFYAKNIAGLNTTGLETAIESSFQLEEGTEWEGGLAFTFLHSESDQPVVSKYISGHARYLLKLHTTVMTGRYSVSINALWKQRDREKAESINSRLHPSYMVWNAKIKAFLWKKSLSATLQANNLFDVEYSDFLGARMPGRWIMAGITWEF